MLYDFKHDRAAIFSAAFLVFIILISIFAFLLPINPNAIDPENILSGPSAQHWFGTDQVGRDYLIRTIYGGRVSLLVGVLAMLTSTVIGVAVGTVAGYFGGIVDNILMRIVDVLSSIPWMILITVVSILLKPGLQTIILVIGLFTWMEIARLVRAETLSVKEREFVMYSQFTGTSSFWIVLRHIIPSVLPTIIISATTSMANAIMTESSLSFLGIGIQQPMSSWGSLLQEAQGNLQNAFYMALIPGILIILTVFSFNKIGNLMRVLIEPKVTAGDE